MRSQCVPGSPKKESLGTMLWLAKMANYFGKWLAIKAIALQWPAVIFKGFPTVYELEVAPTLLAQSKPVPAAARVFSNSLSSLHLTA